MATIEELAGEFSYDILVKACHEAHDEITEHNPNSSLEYRSKAALLLTVDFAVNALAKAVMAQNAALRERIEKLEKGQLLYKQQAHSDLDECLEIMRIAINAQVDVMACTVRKKRLAEIDYALNALNAAMGRMKALRGDTEDDNG